MDWTNVYHESGEEELVIPCPSRTQTAPRMSRLVSIIYHAHHEHPHHHQLPHHRPHAFEEHDDGDEDFASHRLFVLSSEYENGGDKGDDETESSSSSEASEYDGYTLGALYCLSINYILGVGCLGVPYAFARAGFVLCGAIVILVTILSYVTVMWVAETGARVEMEFGTTGALCDTDGDKEERETSTVLVRMSGESNGRKRTEEAESRSNGHGGAAPPPALPLEVENAPRPNGHSDEGTSLLQQSHPLKRRRSSYQSHNHHHHNHPDGRSNTINPHHYEVVDLVSHYLGPIHKAIYQISLMALMYVGLLAYTQVFCGAISALLPPSLTAEESSSWGLIIPQLIFGTVVVPLSCVELDEQIVIQALMAVVRFVAIFIMVGGSVLALMIDSENNNGNGGNDDDHGSPPYFAPEEQDECQMSYTACFSGFGVAFSTALFSQLFQHSVPGLVRPMKGQVDKIKKVPQIFGYSLLTTCTFYLLLGTTAASYFGAQTKSSVNLNFVNFLYGINPTTTPSIIVWTLKIASNVVVMFPALDTLSVFPLIANTLGNNLLASCSPGFVTWVARYVIPRWDGVCGTLHRQFVQIPGGADHHSQNGVDANNGGDRRKSITIEEKKKHIELVSKVGTIFWRLIASIPPLIGSIWATDLSLSLQFAGVAGLYVAFFAPSLLQLASCSPSRALRLFGRKEEEGMKKNTTVYSGWYSSTLLAYPVLIFATFALGVVLLQIRDALRSI